MAGRNGEADLVVELRRRRDVAFLLDVESHAGVGPIGLVATIRTLGLGDNPPVGIRACAGWAWCEWATLWEVVHLYNLLHAQKTQSPPISAAQRLREVSAIFTEAF